ncbi:hypothetical protein BTVI_142669 [Pitangus sulphuratus]|nr:hypothetical protein BTVI_142669 [Pitangus sulphuratus]
MRSEQDIGVCGEKRGLTNMASKGWCSTTGLLCLLWQERKLVMDFDLTGEKISVFMTITSDKEFDLDLCCKSEK